MNNLENEDPEEAVVRLDARPAPQNRIKIDTEMSDKMIARTEGRTRMVYGASAQQVEMMLGT